MWKNEEGKQKYFFWRIWLSIDQVSMKHITVKLDLLTRKLCTVNFVERHRRKAETNHRIVFRHSDHATSFHVPPFYSSGMKDQISHISFRLRVRKG